MSDERPGLPLVITYTVRDEPQWLVDQLLANVPWADHFVEVDNRGQTGGWGHEGQMRTRQRRLIVDELLSRPGGPRRAWVLQLDPDERLEDRAATAVPAELARLEREVPARHLSGASLSFPLREMWTPTQFRTDGDWARKKPRARLFLFDPADSRQTFGDRKIHQGIMPRRRDGDTRVQADVLLYHLKNVEPLNRVKRAAAYLAADPTFSVQRREGKDWTWLFDEEGLELESVDPARAFTPAYDRPYDFVMPH